MKRFFRWLKRKFTPAHKPVGNYGSHGEGKPSIKLTWGFIVPHTARTGGATTPDKKFNEYTYA